MIMDNNAIDRVTIQILDWELEQIEKEFKDQGFDVELMSYTGNINDAFVLGFREFIERLKSNRPKKKTLGIILSTPGGSVIAVEKMVEIVRYHYDEIFFIVPGAAMSAGTIFCMAGDKIYMDYASSLGPIDPQVLKNDTYVPALGYLDKVNELIEKSNNGTLSPAEFAMLQSQDLAELRLYEQAKELSIDLLKEWLVKYKFKNWKTHSTTNPGTLVTIQQKRDRAENIAQQLSNNSLWHSHGRMIGISTIRKQLKLIIEDYTENENLRSNLIEYSTLVTELVAKKQRRIFLHGLIDFEEKVLDEED